LFFREFPDAPRISGLILIAAAGLLILRRRQVQPLDMERTDG
jgi:LPXTG-motif cell wall-anchored protein